jgi:hypothetical protein
MPPRQSRAFRRDHHLGLVLTLLFSLVAWAALVWTIVTVL